MQHGSEYETAQFNFNEKHEIKVCDYFLTWVWKSNNSKIIPIGIVKLINHIKKIKWKKNKKIILALRSQAKYYRISSSLCGGDDWDQHIKDTLEIPSYLNQNIKKELIVRFHTVKWDWECENWNKSYPELNKDFFSCPISKLLKKAKLVISTYNGTLFLELLSANFPAVMLMRYESNLIKPSVKKYYDELYNANILFKNPESLSQHINNIWNNEEKWWNSEKVVKAKNNFSNNFAHYLPNLTSDIYNLIKKF